MDQRFEEAASLTSKPLAVLNKITLPLIRPYILSGAVFVFIFSLFNYGVPALFRVHVYPVEIFAGFSAFYDEGAATAQSLPIVLVALALLLGQRYFMKKRSYVTIDSGTKRNESLLLYKYRKSAFFFAWSILLFSVILPVSVLLMRANSWQSYGAALQTSHKAIITTVVISLISATLVTVLGYFISAVMETKNKWSDTIDLMTFIPFAFPATLLGIGLIYFWNRPITEAVYQSTLILIIAYIARFIPFSIRVLGANLKQISPGLREAACLSEPRWWKRVLYIDLPLSRQAMAAGWIIAFILCMGELGSTLLVIPPGNGTISLRIYTLMHYGANEVVAALSLILIGINMIVSSAVLLGLNEPKS